MKKKISVIIVLVLLISSVSVAFASEELKAVLSDIKLFLNGNRVDKEVVVINGASYLPVRAISESLNLGVEWNGEERAIYLSESKNTDADDAIAKEFGVLDKLQDENEKLKDKVENLEKEISTYKDVKIEGVYAGWYTNSHGKPDLTLTIEKSHNGLYSAKFEFGPSSTASDVPEGSYLMDVEYDKDTKKINLKGNKWIKQPSGYSFVDLIGSVSGEYINGGSIFKGKYLGDFSVKKINK